MIFNRRELATIIGSLRMLQSERDSGYDPYQIDEILTDGNTVKELSTSEIDTLCEHLNTSDTIFKRIAMAIARQNAYVQNTKEATLPDLVRRRQDAFAYLVALEAVRDAMLGCRYQLNILATGRIDGKDPK